MANPNNDIRGTVDAEADVRHRKGFTLIELLAILSVVTVMASLLVPSHARTRSGGQGLQCMANSKALMVANLMYQFDNRDAFPMTFHGGFVPAPSDTSKPWVSGWLDWSTASDNTNPACLLDPRYASLAGYSGRDETIYKCQADVYISKAQQARGWSARVRSISANVYVGKGNAWVSGPWGPPNGPNNLTVYKGATKSSDLLIPGPARTWVYMDEHPDSINDGGSFPPDTSSNMPDLPATYHNGAAGFAMADGHSEMHRWRGPKMNNPTNKNGALGVGFASLNNSATVSGDPDLFWLSFTTPRSSNKTVVDWGRN